MVEKMRFLSVTGPKENIDRVVDTHLSRYEVYLGNILSGLKTTKDLRPCIKTNSYKDVPRRASRLLESYHGLVTDRTDQKMRLEETVEVTNNPGTQLKEPAGWRSALVRRRDGLKASRDRVIPFVGLNYNVERILKFRFIKFRLGRISREYYEKFSSHVYEIIGTVISRCEEREDYMWMVYFVLESLADKVDAIYAFIRFERCFLPGECEDTPMEAGHVLDDRIGSLQKEIDEADRKIVEVMSSRKEELAVVLRRIRIFSTSFDVRKMAAVTKHDTHNFYTLCGWMTEKNTEMFQKGVEQDSDALYIIKGSHNSIMNMPPTEMKNPGLFRPLEMYVEIYGLPSYNELDPTILIGIAYSILFGFTFGDTRQGLCLLIGGFLLYRFKGIRLAGVISCCGMFSTIFGLLFGGIFGFEDTMDTVRFRPQEAVTSLLFIEGLNAIFVAAITIGIGITLLCVTLNVINSLCSHDVEKTHFNTNDVAELIFHFALASVITLYMTGNLLPATVILVIMFLVPFLVIFFKGPLTAIAEKKVERMEAGLGTFVTQDILKLFEVLLSYLSNTLSFVRVGVFAVNYTAMVQIVLMLAEAEAGGNTNWAVMVGGSLFVCGMKDLVVGAQVLRLEYYELFSRLYCSSGRAFELCGKAAGEQ